MSKAYPTSLSQITVGQRVDFYNQYEKEINASKPSIDNAIEYFFWIADAACKSYSFFTEIDLEDIKTNYEVKQIVNAYTATQQTLLEEEAELEVEPSYLWNGSTWYVTAPTDEQGTDTVTFEEFQRNKAVIADMMALSNGDWSKLINLCAIYLRADSEELKDVMPIANDRVELFKDLPLSIGIAVGKFINETLSLYLTSLGMPED